MELVINSNRIIAALIKDSTTRKIILSTKFTFYTVDFGIKEVKKYKELIKTKGGISEQQFSLLMNALLSKIIVLSENEISKKSINKAIQIMNKIDPDDVPFIALSIELNNKPIWSDDKHFKQQKEIKVLNTKQLAREL